ncbi:MAG: DUF3793 family protein [Candidatus Methanomethylophilaceae archaeon]|nr:DUF3793 family protein [Candidatus Methanomethylophilaceae archaeon]
MIEDSTMNNGSVLSDILFHEPCPRVEQICSPAGEPSVSGLHERVVRHCSPTLAGLKCGSMFKLNAEHHVVLCELRDMHRTICHRGVRVLVLCSDSNGPLLYIYRPRLLAKRLEDPEVVDFLRGYGYRVEGVNKTLRELRDRFSTCPMPPEIGVFLDYPMVDVKGYIENEGRCCRCIGCWKVYGDVDAAEKRFMSYKKCRDIYSKRLMQGVPLEKLAIRC